MEALSVFKKFQLSLSFGQFSPNLFLFQFLILISSGILKHCHYCCIYLFDY